jgi:hypothetical protein
MKQKRGRPRTIKTEEHMLQLFNDYATETKADYRIMYVFVGKDGKEVQQKLERPLTIDGFVTYCWRAGFKNVQEMLDNRNNSFEDLTKICAYIKSEIRNDMITGAIAGQYKENIVARLNGISEKMEQKFKIEQPLFPDVEPLDNNSLPDSE